MKNYVVLIIMLFALGSCGTSQSDIDTAKQDLLWNTQVSEKSPESIQKKEEAIQEKSNLVQIIPMDDQRLLAIDDISEATLKIWEVVITGAVTSSVDRIDVLFSNPTSKYPDDDYTLQAYEAWDMIFKYIASSKNQVLDFGENEYIFRAYSWDLVSDTKVILEVSDEDEEETTGKELNLVGVEENTILIDLPTSSKYGEPMKLWEESFTYTQIKGLEINKEILENISCETLTEYLTERMNSWYYWNTCREIVKDKGIKFNVIRLAWEEYVYERHYIDFVHGFYGTYELETGVWVTSENIADKNSELKEREFPSLDIVDDLIKDIVNT